MDLFMFYVGGNAGKSNIEVHDVQFAAANHPEDACSCLRETWFGDKDKLHIDGYARITWVDGYKVVLSERPCGTGKHLFFVNVGAYSPHDLAELHAFDLFVEDSQELAKARAKQKLLNGKVNRHKDNLKSVDDCLLLDKVGNFFIRLVPEPIGTPFKPEWQGYLPIGVDSSKLWSAPEMLD